jgi:hypothetical protein
LCTKDGRSTVADKNKLQTKQLKMPIRIIFKSEYAGHTVLGQEEDRKNMKR